VDPSSEWLYPTLYESPDELDARKLFLGRGSELLNFLHQRLCDLHFFFRKLVPLGHPGLKSCGGPKLFEPKIFASGGLIFGIKPFRPPTGIVFGRLEIEIWNVWAHLAAEAASLIAQRVPDGENPVPECPMGLDPQKALAKRNEARDMQNRIGI
jgi:hypothetical protein